MADNLLAAGCQLSLVFSFLGAMLIRLYEEFSLIYGEVVVARIMVFSSTAVVAAPLVGITLLMLILMLLIMIILIQHEGRQPIIRLVATGMPPRLALTSGQKWHLFLSHVNAKLPPAALNTRPLACRSTTLTFARICVYLRPGHQPRISAPSSSDSLYACCQVS